MIRRKKWMEEKTKRMKIQKTILYIVVALGIIYFSACKASLKERTELGKTIVADKSFFPGINEDVKKLVHEWCDKAIEAQELKTDQYQYLSFAFKEPEPDIDAIINKYGKSDRIKNLPISFSYGMKNCKVYFYGVMGFATFATGKKVKRLSIGWE